MAQPVKVRNILLFPLLLLLHLLFITSSLLLRLYQHLTQTTSSQIPLNPNPPRHVALVLKPSPRSSRSRCRAETIALRSSVSKAVLWAGEAGIDELSIFDGLGLMESCRDDIMLDVTRLPPSPPSSSASSPGRRTSHNRTNMDTDDDHLTLVDSKHESTQKIHGGVATLTVFPASQTKSSRPLLVHLLPRSSSSGMMADLTRSYISLPPSEITQQRIDIDIKGVQCPSFALAVFINGDLLPYIILSKISSVLKLDADPPFGRGIAFHIRPIITHYPPALTAVVLTSNPTEVPPRNIRISILASTYHGNLSALVQLLHQYSPPHPLPAGAAAESLIPTLSHHSTPLPLPTALVDILGPLLDRAEESSMPLIRKFARAIPREHDGAGLAMGREVYGALRKEEWEGAMDAWGKVEQRLGK